jgi:signal transduction histidine kinase
VEISYRSAAHSIVVGTELLRDLFGNLLGNAIKHSTGDVRVDIDVSPQTVQGQAFFRVDVADNGPDIPDEVKVRLFQKGARGVTKAPGRGLGLFLAYNIVTGVGGRIWVEDRVPGDHSKGTRFVVLLPQATAGI